MKTLLVYPRGRVIFNSPPLGIAYIAAYMREKGLDVELFDATFAPSLEQIFERIKKSNADIVAFSLLTRLLRDVRVLTKKIKEYRKDIVLVAGGPHATALPEECLSDYNFDIVVIGEGEETLTELVHVIETQKEQSSFVNKETSSKFPVSQKNQRFFSGSQKPKVSVEKEKLEKVKGIAFKKDGKIVKTEPRPFIKDIDSLPFPARDLLPMKKYFEASLGRTHWAVANPSTTIIGVRGCPFNCTFCSARFTQGRIVRERSPKSIADEIEMLVYEYKIRGLWFNDDTFGINKKWINEIFEDLRQRGIKIDWACNTRVNVIDEEYLVLIKKHGCKLISIGIESGVQRVLDNCLRKGITLEQAEKAFKLIEKVGILSQASFMLGIPGETLEDMKNTIRFAKKLEPDCILANITIPLPATEITELAKKEGEIEMTSWEEMDFMSEGVIKTKDFTPEQVRRMQKKFLRGFYLRPKYFLTQLRRTKSPENLKLRLKGMMQLTGAHRKQLYQKAVPDEWK